MEVDALASTPQKLSNIALVPYVQMDKWTIPEDVIRTMFQRMQVEGTVSRVFYDGSVSTPDQFLDLFQRPTNIMVVFFIDSAPIGFAWLNGHNGNASYGHFCFFSNARKRAEAAMQLGIKYWFALGVCDVLIGMIPTFNEKAIRFAQRVGFKMVGTIPGMGKSVTGVGHDMSILYRAR